MSVFSDADDKKMLQYKLWLSKRDQVTGDTKDMRSKLQKVLRLSVLDFKGWDPRRLEAVDKSLADCLDKILELRREIRWVTGNHKTINKWPISD